MIEESTKQNDWTSVLDSIEDALATALQSAEERQRNFEESLNIEDSQRPHAESWTKGLQDFHQRMQEMVAIAERAAQSVVNIDATLAEEEKLLQHWMGDAESGKMKLSEWLKAEGEPPSDQ